MNKQQAILLLSLGEDFDHEDLVDAFENKLFEIKSYFLNQYPLPKLVNTRFRKICQLFEAKNYLQEKDFEAKEIKYFPVEFEIGTIKDFFKSYESKLAACRVKINASFSDTLFDFVSEYYSVQKSYYLYMHELYMEIDFKDVKYQELKLSEQKSFVELLEDIPEKIVDYSLTDFSDKLTSFATNLDFIKLNSEAFRIKKLL